MGTQLLTINDVMDRLKLSRRTVYRIIEKGELHPFKVEGSLRFEETDVEAYIQRAKQASGLGD